MTASGQWRPVLDAARDGSGGCFIDVQGRGPSARDRPPSGGELGLEPDEGAVAEPGLRDGVRGRVVLSLTCRGPSGGGGGVVAVPGLVVVAEYRAGLEGLGPEAGGGRALRVVASCRLADDANRGS